MPESDVIDRKLREVRDQLERMREQLESLSTAIWHDIDHDDPARLKEGVRFKEDFNERRTSLEKTMEQMLTLLRTYPPKGPGTGLSEPEHEIAQEAMEQAKEEESTEPAPAEPAPAAPLASGLDQKVPFGFVLGEKTYTSASAWPLFYEALLQELYGRAPEKLSRLADAPDGIGEGGRRLFARVPDPLDDPLPIANSIFAEADMAPEALLQVIKRLISDMGYPLDSFKILLKEKNRGTVETLSLAA